MRSQATLREKLGIVNFTWSNMAQVSIPNAETLSHFRLRVVSYIQQLVEQPGNYLVITHCGVLNAIYRHTKQLPLNASISNLQWKNAELTQLTTKPKDLLYHHWEFDLLAETQQCEQQ